MKEFVLKHKLTLLGIGVGMVVGYFYSFSIGCESGSCAITSNPKNSTLYGGMMGGLLFSIFKKDKVK